MIFSPSKKFDRGNCNVRCLTATVIRPESKERSKTGCKNSSCSEDEPEYQPFPQVVHAEGSGFDSRRIGPGLIPGSAVNGPGTGLYK